MTDSSKYSHAQTNQFSSWLIGVGSAIASAVVILVIVCVYAMCRRLARSTSLATITYEMQKRAEMELRATISREAKVRPRCALPGARSSADSSNECAYNYPRRSEYAADSQIHFGYCWEINREELELGKVMGKGMSGIVVKARYTGHNPAIPNTVAIKTATEEFQGTEKEMNLFAEVEMIRVIGKHPNIVDLLGTCTANGPLYLVSEFAMHGNLRDFLRRSEKDVEIGESIDRVLLLWFAHQVAMGMKFLIGQGCIHRDLAARNVLVSEGYVLKICDFGLAKFVGSRGYYKRIEDEILPIRWMAPEAVINGIFSSKSDVWSYGILLWEIMSFGAKPYADLPSSEKLLELLPKGYRMKRPDNCSLHTYSIMKKCWKYKAEQRPTFGVLLRDTFCILPNARESVTSGSRINISNDLYNQGSNSQPPASNLSKADIEEAPILYYEKIL